MRDLMMGYAVLIQEGEVFGLDVSRVETSQIEARDAQYQMPNFGRSFDQQVEVRGDLRARWSFSAARVELLEALLHQSPSEEAIAAALSALRLCEA